ncbi:TPA: hypothetical protein SMF67_001066 [Serratia marcescens]|nr:hypothetical protein [Serratia marcescens]HEJ7090434.1 hypothetical protein [Serratia marcescens]
MTLTTTEELKHLASSDNTNELTRRLARECLANREAQPVAWRHDNGPFAGMAITRAKSVADSWIAKGWTVTPLYTAQPAPAVPDKKTFEQVAEEVADDIGGYSIRDCIVAALWWNACRAAMLAQPVSQRYTLPPHVFRELVNSLRDTAVKYQGTQQLREQLSRTLTDKGLSAAAQEGGNDHDAGR